MTVRLLLAVVVTVALLASAMPAVEEAQRIRASHQLTETTEGIQTAAATLARQNDPVPPGVPAARLRVRVELPETPSDAALRIGGPASTTDAVSNTPSAEERSVLVARVPGRSPKMYPVDVPIRVAGQDGAVKPGPLVLREDTTLTLEYRLVDGRPTVVVTRGFKSGNRTTQSHV